MTNAEPLSQEASSVPERAIEFMEELLLQNSLDTWLVAAIISVSTLVLLFLIRHLVKRKVSAAAQTEHSPLGDFFIGLLQRVKVFVLIIGALFAGSRVLELSAQASVILEKSFILAVLIQTAAWCSFLAGYFLERYHIHKMGEDSASTVASISAIRFIIRLLIWVVFGVLVLDNLGFNITALVAGLGVGGIAVALAAQNVLGDLFASFLIILDKPFAVGDFIIVDSFLGTVEHVGLKTTRLRSLSGEQIIFSNADLLGSRVRNYKRMQERRIVFSLGVEYGTPYKLVQDIPKMIKAIIDADEHTRFDRAHFKEFAASSLDFEVVYYTLNPDYNHYMDVQERINLAVYKKFEEKKISFAFPTQKIFLDQEKGVSAKVVKGAQKLPGTRKA